MNLKNTVYFFGTFLLFFIVYGFMQTANINPNENNVIIYQEYNFTTTNNTFILQDNTILDETIYVWNYEPQNCTIQNHYELICEEKTNTTTIKYTIKL